MNIGRNWRLKQDEDFNLVFYHKDPTKDKWKATHVIRPPRTHVIKKKKLDKEAKKAEAESKKDESEKSEKQESEKSFLEHSDISNLLQVVHLPAPPPRSQSQDPT